MHTGNILQFQNCPLVTTPFTRRDHRHRGEKVKWRLLQCTNSGLSGRVFSWLSSPDDSLQNSFDALLQKSHDISLSFLFAIPPQLPRKQRLEKITPMAIPNTAITNTMIVNMMAVHILFSPQLIGCSEEIEGYIVPPLCQPLA